MTHHRRRGRVNGANRRRPPSPLAFDFSTSTFGPRRVPHVTVPPLALLCCPPLLRCSAALLCCPPRVPSSGALLWRPPLLPSSVALLCCPPLAPSSAALLCCPPAPGPSPRLVGPCARGAPGHDDATTRPARRRRGWRKSSSTAIPPRFRLFDLDKSTSTEPAGGSRREPGAPRREPGREAARSSLDARAWTLEAARSRLHARGSPPRASIS
jgi:hypothetical protein